MTEYGEYLAYGTGGLIADKQAAVELWRRAAGARPSAGMAAKGDARAQYRLGQAMSMAHGTRQDMDEARIWLDASAAQGYEPAKVWRALEDESCPPERVFSLCENLRSAEGRFEAGTLCMSVWPSRKRHALAWLEMAAKEGHRHAAARLGLSIEGPGGADMALSQLKRR